MFPGKTKQEVVSQFRCSEILSAARKVFAAKGFTDTTVDEIAAAAGLAKGTVYLYFPSKRDIYLAALKNGIAELLETTRRNMEAAPDMRGKIRAFIESRLLYVERDRDFFRIYHSEFGNITHPASIDQELRDMYGQQLERLEAILGEAEEAGEIRPLPVAAAASAIYEMVRGLMLRRVLGWSRSTVEEDVEALEAMVWEGIGKR